MQGHVSFGEIDKLYGQISHKKLLVVRAFRNADLYKVIAGITKLEPS